ncbi:unnamed protein product [Protopolystoma xenopodis]|uniref:Uncharacterized protein n=1 Tax=Protopolystoma xenopodis TaxID=117903 RepID=A0A3S5B6G3_9PLAT|nr:unnamed protein product [Protopolystoma xenopodis]
MLAKTVPVGQQRRLVNSLWPGLDSASASASASASPGLGLVSGAPACPPTRRHDRATATSTSTATATATATSTVSLGGLTGVGRLQLGAIGASDRAESRDPVEWIQTPTTPTATATATATATGARSKSDSGAFSASDEGGVGGGGAAFCRPLRFSIGDLIEEEKCAGSALFAVDQASRLVRVECRKPGCRCVLKHQSLLALKVVSGVSLVQAVRLPGDSASDRLLGLFGLGPAPSSQSDAGASPPIMLTSCCPFWFELVHKTPSGPSDTTPCHGPPLPVWTSAKAVWKARPPLFLVRAPTRCFLSRDSTGQALFAARSRSRTPSRQNRLQPPNDTVGVGVGVGVVSLDADVPLRLRPGTVLRLLDCRICRLFSAATASPSSPSSPFTSSSSSCVSAASGGARTLPMLHCSVVGGRALSSLASAHVSNGDVNGDVDGDGDVFGWFALTGPRPVFLPLDDASVAFSPVALSSRLAGNGDGDAADWAGGGAHSLISLLTRYRLPLTVRLLLDPTPTSTSTSTCDWLSAARRPAPCLRLFECFHGDLVFLEPLSDCHGDGDGDGASRFFVVTADMLAQHTLLVAEATSARGHRRRLERHAARVAHFLAATHPVYGLAYLLRYLEETTQYSTTGPPHAPLTRTLGPPRVALALALDDASPSASVAAAAAIAVGEADDLVMPTDVDTDANGDGDADGSSRLRSAAGLLTPLACGVAATPANLVAKETDELNARRRPPTQACRTHVASAARRPGGRLAASTAIGPAGAARRPMAGLADGDSPCRRAVGVGVGGRLAALHAPIAARQPAPAAVHLALAAPIGTRARLARTADNGDADADADASTQTGLGRGRLASLRGSAPPRRFGRGDDALPRQHAQPRPSAQPPAQPRRVHTPTTTGTTPATATRLRDHAGLVRRDADANGDADGDGDGDELGGRRSGLAGSHQHQHHHHHQRRNDRPLGLLPARAAPPRRVAARPARLADQSARGHVTGASTSVSSPAGQTAPTVPTASTASPAPAPAELHVHNLTQKPLSLSLSLSLSLFVSSSTPPSLALQSPGALAIAFSVAFSRLLSILSFFYLFFSSGLFFILFFFYFFFSSRLLFILSSTLSSRLVFSFCFSSIYSSRLIFFSLCLYSTSYSRLVFFSFCFSSRLVFFTFCLSFILSSRLFILSFFYLFFSSRLVSSTILTVSTPRFAALLSLPTFPPNSYPPSRPFFFLHSFRLLFSAILCHRTQEQTGPPAMLVVLFALYIKPVNIHQPPCPQTSGPAHSPTHPFTHSPIRLKRQLDLSSRQSPSVRGQSASR